MYRSSDTGAPQLSNNNDGSLLTILRACLVDGYGSGNNARTPSGWTMPYSDIPNGLACFKALDGDYIRLNDGLDYRYASVSGFKEMTDIDNGTEEYPNIDQLGSGYHYRVFKKFTSGSLYGAWVVLATDKWFYFLGLHNDNSPNRSTGFFFGQYDCVNDSFEHNWVVSGYKTTLNDTYITNTLFYPIFVSSNIMYGRRNYQNGEQPVSLTQVWDITAYDQPNPFTGFIEMGSTIILDTDTPYVKYGSLPERYKILSSSNLTYRGGETITDGINNYVIGAFSSGLAFAFRYDENVG